MTDAENRRLAIEAEEKLRIEHDVLWNARARAADALFRARIMGGLGTPDLVVDREDVLANAKSCLEAWEKANKWQANLVEPPTRSARARSPRRMRSRGTL
jgi:hypothetical protein